MAETTGHYKEQGFGRFAPPLLWKRFQDTGTRRQAGVPSLSHREAQMPGERSKFTKLQKIKYGIPGSGSIWQEMVFVRRPPQNANTDETIYITNQLAQEMKDRESKRWLLEEFIKENEIRAVELEMAYKRFKNLAPSSGSGGKQTTSSVEMDFNTWILVSSSSGREQLRARTAGTYGIFRRVRYLLEGWVARHACRHFKSALSCLVCRPVYAPQ